MFIIVLLMYVLNFRKIEVGGTEIMKPKEKTKFLQNTLNLELFYIFSCTVLENGFPKEYLR